MSVSVILQTLPADQRLWSPYIEHLRSIESVSECRIVVNNESAPEYSRMLSLADDFFEVGMASEADNAAQLLNQAAASAKTDTLLLLEKPFWLAFRADEQRAWHELDDARSIRQIQRTISDGVAGVADGEASVFEVPVPDEELGLAFLISKKHFLEMRGYDESDDVFGALGYDLLLRQRRASLPVDQKLAGYNALIGQTEFYSDTGLEADFKKAAIATHTLYRNLSAWSVDPDLREPLVSVAIASKDRGSMLIESINSVRYQSFQEFEIIVVDDGSADQESTRRAIEALNDPRISFYAHSESKGVAAARNTAASRSTCLLTAVHDDDDIMLPDRLLEGIKPLSDQIDATYGSWINFDDETGELKGFLTRVGFDANLIAFNGSGPGHSTRTVPTRLVQQFKYDERLTSSVDHELAARMANAGVRWHHVQQFMYLRRVHDLQITAQDTDNQKAGHTLSKLANRFLTVKSGLEKMSEKGSASAYPKVKGAGALNQEFAGYLPDHLVRRELVFKGNSVTKSRAADMPERVSSIVTDRDLLSGRLIFEEGTIKDVRQADLVALREAGVTNFEVRSSGPRAGFEDHEHVVEDEKILELEIGQRVQHLMLTRLRDVADQISKQNRRTHFVVATSNDAGPLFESHLAASEPTVLRRIVASAELGVSVSAYLLGFESSRASIQALNRLSELDSSAGVFLMNEDPAAVFAEIGQEIGDAVVRDSIDDSGLAGV
ncbi:glycosyltransferase family 2 protein [Corynebacterium godavarianum]|uniref:Glycosyltransferase family 2 protein n=1 Tax=Corynebacterium godavarianum TaxID=2054421 RepID=A0ABY3DXY9_9CORY|nr:glycosyltransferase family 2 protein [Corynebacterium godavarianum]MBL7286392.1 glycosyltransferase family 2 protein [Corynebacterium godavarianum]TSJ70420.1 glycosyltransferase family 2 protein [Corynebacterium godavarianum]